jgi:TrmH family RNA methyltransferase
MTIESTQNTKVKQLMRLIGKNSERKAAEVFVVEGAQENERALHFGYQPQEFFICDNLLKIDFAENLPDYLINCVSEKVYEKIAYRGTTEGIIGVYKTKNADLEEFTPHPNAAIIVLEGIEKPGNLGAILRSCEAFGIDALVVTDTRTDFYNPNVIRSSVGCLFGMNVFATTNEKLFDFLQKNNFNIFTTLMSENAKKLQNVDLQQNTVLVFGTEHEGLSDFWKQKGENVLIPMCGTIDSLNLSNAVAISCYEILRQKE